MKTSSKGKTPCKHARANFVNSAEWDYDKKKWVYRCPSCKQDITCGRCGQYITYPSRKCDHKKV